MSIVLNVVSVLEKTNITAEDLRVRKRLPSDGV